MDVEWQLDAFRAEMPSRSPTPGYIPRSLSNSPISISSADHDSRSSTAEAEVSHKPNPDKTPVTPHVHITQPAPTSRRPRWDEHAPLRNKVSATKNVDLHETGSRAATFSESIKMPDLELRSSVEAKDAKSGQLPTPSASSVAGGAILSDTTNSQKVFPLVRDERLLPGPPVQQGRSGRADQRALGLYILCGKNKKKALETQLENHKRCQDRNKNIQSMKSDNMSEGLGQSLKRSQGLLAIAQAQVQQQMGMSLTDKEKDLAKLFYSSAPSTEQHIRDSIFIESVKIELFNLQLSETIGSTGEEKEPEKTSDMKESTLDLVRNAKANATASNFVGEWVAPSTSAEIEQTNQRREQREKRDQEPSFLPHKLAKPPGPQPAASNEFPQRPPPFHNSHGPPPPPPCGPSFSTSGTYRSPPERLIQRPPNNSSTMDNRPPPPPPQPGSRSLPGLPPIMHPGPQPPPPGCYGRPPPGARAFPPPPPGFLPPCPKPMISTTSQSESNAKTINIGTTASGVSVKTFSSAEGSTSTTMTTSPGFEVDNGIEIITKTVKCGNTVTTTTTTTLIPFTENQKKLKNRSPKGNGRALTDDDSGDESDFSGSSVRSIF